MNLLIKTNTPTDSNKIYSTLITECDKYLGKWNSYIYIQPDIFAYIYIAFLYLIYFNRLSTIK